MISKMRMLQIKHIHTYLSTGLICCCFFFARFLPLILSSFIISYKICLFEYLIIFILLIRQGMADYEFAQ